MGEELGRCLAVLPGRGDPAHDPARRTATRLVIAHQTGFLPRAKRNGSTLDTDLERFSLGGPRIEHLATVVRDREWCPAAITNSLCVKCARVSWRVNTREKRRRHIPVLAGTRCYTCPTRRRGRPAYVNGDRPPSIRGRHARPALEGTAPVAAAESACSLSRFHPAPAPSISFGRCSTGYCSPFRRRR